MATAWNAHALQARGSVGYIPKAKRQDSLFLAVIQKANDIAKDQVPGVFVAWLASCFVVCLLFILGVLAAGALSFLNIIEPPSSIGTNEFIVMGAVVHIFGQLYAYFLILKEHASGS